MKNFTHFEIWYGRDEPPPPVELMKTGPFSIEFQAGALRYVKWIEAELIRHIYFAVRDVNWNTIPATISGLITSKTETHFHIAFDAFHQKGAIQFRCHAILNGQSDGTFTCVMDGMAESDFRYQRIGFCILLPIQGVAGQIYRAITPQGEIQGRLSNNVFPQQVDHGSDVPIFPACSQLIINYKNGVLLTSEFEGSLFEMEDQRNWSDGSYKIYSSAISKGLTHQAVSGQKFHQKVVIKLIVPHDEQEISPQINPKIQIFLGPLTNQSLPKLGFGIPTDVRLSSNEVNMLSKLQPDHLKIEIHLQEPSWPEKLADAKTTASILGCPLELSLFLNDHPEVALNNLRDIVYDILISRVIVFHEKEAPNGTTSPRWMILARETLAESHPQTLFVGGTNGNFAELNRQLPDISVMDGVAYTINPQVHLVDERTLVEAIEAQRDTLMTARGYSGFLPISISSVTFKAPFNQAATEAENEDNQMLPASVDQRQMSLFGAAWTVGSIHSLTSGGADSITYYELTGWHGLIESAIGNPMPKHFRSINGMVFPIYWVFRFLTDAKKAFLIHTVSTPPMLVDCLALQKKQQIYLAISNYQAQDQEVMINDIPNGMVKRFSLNQDTYQVAAFNPNYFMVDSQAVLVADGNISMTLKPYETAFVKIMKKQ